MEQGNWQDMTPEEKGEWGTKSGFPKEGSSSAGIRAIQTAEDLTEAEVLALISSGELDSERPLCESKTVQGGWWLLKGPGYRDQFVEDVKERAAHLPN